MKITIRAMDKADFLSCKALWEHDPHISASLVQNRGSFERYLDHNPGCSQVAIDDHGTVIGAIAAGHDGYRGSCHHLYVDPAYRQQGVARQLAHAAMQGLRQHGIDFCFVWIYSDNSLGEHFWQQAGFERWDNCPTWSRRLNDQGSSDQGSSDQGTS